MTEEYDPLLDALIERLRHGSIDDNLLDAAKEAADILSTWARSLNDREARVVRMRDMLSQAAQADNARLRGEVKMHERSAAAKGDEIASLRTENARLKRLELVPVGSILPQCFREQKEPWCREVLLYSPSNSGDTPSNRTLLYAAMSPPSKEQA